MYPSPFPLRLKRPWPPGLPSFTGMAPISIYTQMSASYLGWREREREILIPELAILYLFNAHLLLLSHAVEHQQVRNRSPS